MGFNEQTFDDTLEYCRQEPLYFHKRHRSNIDKGELVAMLVITWCTFLVGLGNLIFLKRRRRRNAIIALSVAVAVGVPLMLFVSPAGFFLVLILGVWMTLDAVHSYRVSNEIKSSLADKYGGFLE